jgi:TrmH family RNA methyltransferase
VKIYAAVAEESQNSGRGRDAPFLAPWNVDWKAAAAILIGNEGAGLPAELVRAADALVYIPQSTGAARVGIESLNAAMAASVLLYEAMRQRNAARRRTP